MLWDILGDAFFAVVALLLYIDTRRNPERYGVRDLRRLYLGLALLLTLDIVLRILGWVK